MRYVLALSVALLSACTTFPDMDKGLTTLMHRKPDEAFSVLGYPDNKLEIQGDTVYVWSSSNSGSVSVPVTNTTTGIINGVPVYGATTTSQSIPINGQCTIKLVEGMNGRLKDWNYKGNQSGCRSYSMALRRYYRDAYGLPDQKWDNPTTP